jgi:hypothetical protein
MILDTLVLARRWEMNDEWWMHGVQDEQFLFLHRNIQIVAFQCSYHNPTKDERRSVRDPGFMTGWGMASNPKSASVSRGRTDFCYLENWHLCQSQYLRVVPACRCSRWCCKISLWDSQKNYQLNISRPRLSLEVSSRKRTRLYPLQFWCLVMD